jgi:hypothetical protein
MRSIRARVRRPSAPLLVALLALFVALGGPAEAERLINGAKIKRNSVGSKQIKNRSVRGRDLAPAAVRSLRATPNRSITDAKLADGAVTTRAFAPGSVQPASIADNSIGAADLATNSVGTDEIADNAVGQAEIRSNGVAASEIADNSIDGGEIIDGGLSVRDVARQVGTLQWPIDPVAPSKCQLAWVPVDGIQIAGDFVLISPNAPWPDELVYTVNGVNAANQFKVAACNERGSTAVPASRTTYTFNYAIVGF